MAQFGGKRVLVAGDLMLDRYWWGVVDRVSPEAPVPVVRRMSASGLPGGAANTASNVASLGAAVSLFGIAGQDEAGRELRYLLAKANVDCEPVLADATRPTTVKTRIIAHDQHVVRIDEEDTTPVSPRIAAQIASRVEEAMENADAVLISDYAKGAMTPEVLRRILAAAKRFGKPAVVDPKGHDWKIYSGATVIKPNRGELVALTGLAVRNHADTISAARCLAAAMVSTTVLVTEGKEGMTFLCPAGAEREFPAYARHVYDVTGAGDTVSAALTLALACGAALEEAAWLSNVAASLAVAEVGTVAVTREKLAAAVALAPEPGLAHN